MIPYDSLFLPTILKPKTPRFNTPFFFSIAPDGPRLNGGSATDRAGISGDLKDRVTRFLQYAYHSQTDARFINRMGQGTGHAAVQGQGRRREGGIPLHVLPEIGWGGWVPVVQLPSEDVGQEPCPGSMFGR